MLPLTPEMRSGGGDCDVNADVKPTVLTSKSWQRSISMSMPWSVCR
jgi:hypothetical protein